MKMIVLMFFALVFANITYGQQIVTFKTIEYILSSNVKNTSLDSVMKTLGFKLRTSEQWPAQFNWHYYNGYDKNDKRYATFDVSILLSDQNKFYVAYTCRNDSDIKNILKEALSKGNYNSSDVYLSHFSQPDDYLGKEYKNDMYDISTLSSKYNNTIDYGIAVGLEAEYKKTQVIITPDK